MSFFDPQNPGIGGLKELTSAEVSVVQALASLGDPNANRILGWDDTDNTYAYFTIGTGLSYDHATHTLTAAGSGLTIGTTTITSGTNTRILYDNAGVLGEYTITGTGTVVAMQTNPTLSGLTIADATNIVLNTTTGTKIGTATTQKLAFYNSTPIVKPTGDVATALSNLGLVASPTIIATTNANLTGAITSVGNATSIASQTGTGTKFVVDTSPTLVTPILGIATATSINKIILTAPATSATLTIADGKTLTISNSLTLAGTDSTVLTFPATSAIIARTDAAQTFTGVQTFSTPIATGSVATMTATVGGGVPTPPNNTTTFLRGDGTFAAPGASTFSPTTIYSTIFETSTRFTSTASGGTNTFNANGVLMTTTSTSNRRAGLQVNSFSNDNSFLRSPAVSASCTISTNNGTAGFLFLGIGDVQGTITANHIGFKVIYNGTATLVASQADGTTENVSSALTTFATSDLLEIAFKVNGTSSVDYYWSKNGGAWSSVINLTSNMPSGSTQIWLDVSLTNGAAATNNSIQLNSYSYNK